MGFLELNEELEALEGKKDPFPRTRYLQIADELITLDMAMGYEKRAIGRAAREKDIRKRSEELARPLGEDL